MSAVPEAMVTRVEFARGPQSGTTLALHENVLVHRGPQVLETIPLAALAAVRIAYCRHRTRIAWAVVLLALALAVWAAASPLATLAHGAAGEVVAQARGEGASGAQGVASALLAVFRGIEVAARLLPLLAAAFLVAALGLAGFGLWGMTTLTLTLGAVERDFSVRGRNESLYDFAEALSERLIARGH